MSRSFVDVARSSDDNLSPVIIVSTSGQIRYANRASWLLLQQWRVSIGDTIADSLWLDAVRIAGSFRRTEERMLSVGYVLIRLLFVPDTETSDVLVFGTDATRAGQEEKELLIKAHIYAQAHEAIVVTDSQFRTIEINPAYKRLTGFDEAMALGEEPPFLKSARRESGLFGSIIEGLTDNDTWEGEIWVRNSQGRRIALRISISAIRFQCDSVTHYVAFLSDVTASKLAQDQLNRMAHYDGLTGLPNRYLFIDYVHNEISHMKRSNGELAVMLLDLDGFKAINDSYGHGVGDQLLQVVGQRMTAALRTSDIIARLGGDEFAVLARDLSSPTDAVAIADKLLLAVSKPMKIGEDEVQLTASIGIALYPSDSTVIDALIKNADEAMYSIKKHTKNGYRFVSETNKRDTTRDAQLRHRLSEAVDRNEITVQYQPIVETASGRITGVEALSRWTDERFGVVPSGEFISIAEESDLILRLGTAIIEKACTQGSLWNHRFRDQLRIGVNVSIRQLRNPDFVDNVDRILTETGLAPECLELELTETIFVEEATDILSTLKAFAAMNVSLAIDDFGTRYASLLYLKAFPVHRLKIDHLFIRDIVREESAAQIVAAIVTLGENLGFDVIAEGVETPGQLELLTQMGCKYAQGFLFGHAQGPESIAEILHTRYNESSHHIGDGVNGNVPDQHRSAGRL